jgi:hypothetical protein
MLPSVKKTHNTQVTSINAAIPSTSVADALIYDPRVLAMEPNAVIAIW